MPFKLPFITRGHRGGMDFRETDVDISPLWLVAYLSIVCIFFVVMILRLFQLTVVKGEYYRGLAENNRIREIVVEPERGTLVDRKGVVLAHNIPADLHSEGTRLVSKRIYNDTVPLAHIIGYRQVGDTRDLEQDPCTNKMKVGDKVGKKSIEKIYECDLRGTAGKKLVEVDSSGKIIRTINVAPPVSGKTLHLAVDAELQKKAFEQIKGKKAVVVGLKPDTGEVLILASTPSFDPQDFEDGQADIGHYFTDKDKPLFNRAVEGTYPPGSVFKMVLAVGALEEKKIDETTIIQDNGFLKAGPLEFGNWYYLQYGKTEGPVDIVKAIRRSNDIFFYTVGNKLTSEGIKRWSEKFGYGNKTGIGLDEAEGTIPSPFWKEETLKEQWYLGDTYNMSIGQGYILTTPLQVAVSTAALANNGSLCTPQLLKMNSSDGIMPQCKKLPVSAKTLSLVKEGMIGACSTGGTGWPFFEFKVKSEKLKVGETIQVACKTGTAEAHADSKNPHAWFTVYAPAEKPEIVLTVLVEEAGQGSDIAAPIAKEILTSYFEKNQ